MALTWLYIQKAVKAQKVVGYVTAFSDALEFGKR